MDEVAKQIKYSMIVMAAASVGIMLASIGIVVELAQIIKLLGGWQ
jgi:hypothetical protein